MIRSHRRDAAKGQLIHLQSIHIDRLHCTGYKHTLATLLHQFSATPPVTVTGIPWQKGIKTENDAKIFV